MRRKFSILSFFIIVGILFAGCMDSHTIINKAKEKNPIQVNQTFSPYEFPVISDPPISTIIYNHSRKPQFISKTLDTPSGRITINAWANDSAISIPVFRINESESIDFSIDRYDVAIPHPPYTEENNKKIIASLPGEKEALVLASTVLRPCGGIPPDAGNPEYRPNIGGDPTAFFIIIHYPRSINGLLVERYGIDGDKIWIHFGQNGDLIRLEKIWRKIDYIQNVKVISIDEALDRLQKGEIANGESGNNRISSVYLGYYDEPEISDIPEPVWIFSGINQWGGSAEYYVYAAEQGSISSTLNKTLPESTVTIYRNNEMLHTGFPNKHVSSDEAIEIVKNFSGGSESAVHFERTEHFESRCSGYSYDSYLLSSDKGTFRVYPDTGEIMSVEYNIATYGSLIRQINVSQAISISQKFLAERFSGFNEHPSSLAIKIIEKEETFDLFYPSSRYDLGTEITVSKNTGEVLSFSDEHMISHSLC